MIVDHPRNLIDTPVELNEILVKEINTAGRERQEYRNMEELKLSVKQKGLIHPIAVMRYDETYEGFNYFLLAGGRRTRAFKELEFEKIPARIYPSDLNAFEIRAIELEENLRREDLTDAERLKSIKKLHDLYTDLYGEKKSTSSNAKGHSMRDTAKKLGVSKSKVSEDYNLGQWLEDVPSLSKLPNRAAIVRAVRTAKKQAARDKRLADYKIPDKIEDKELNELREKSYIVGSFLDKSKGIPDNTIDLIDFDPDYPIEEDDQMFSGVELDRASGIYKGIPKKDYPDFVKAVFKESYRILADGGWLIVWFGREYFKDLQTWGHEAGLRTSWYTGRWCKGGEYASTRNPYSRLGHSIEEFFYFSKDVGEIVTPHADEFKFAPTKRNDKTHPFEKPELLMLDILETFVNPGSRIVVPCAGSGNTMLAGFRYKCTCIGFDPSEEYKKDYVLKVREL